MNKKIISIIFIIALFFVLSLFNNVYAVSVEGVADPHYDTELNYTIISNLSSILSEDGKDINDYDYIICNGLWGALNQYCYCFRKSTSRKAYLRLSGDDVDIYIGSNTTYYRYDVSSTGELTFDKQDTGKYIYSAGSSSSFYLYSSCDIYTDSTCTDFFFQPEIPIVAQKVLQVEKILPQTMKEIVGLLPMILALLVSLLGLTKGLRIIKNLIHKA